MGADAGASTAADSVVTKDKTPESSEKEETKQTSPAKKPAVVKKGTAKHVKKGVGKAVGPKKVTATLKPASTKPTKSKKAVEPPTEEKESVKDRDETEEEENEGKLNSPLVQAPDTPDVSLSGGVGQFCIADEELSETFDASDFPLYTADNVRNARDDDMSLSDYNEWSIQNDYNLWVPENAAPREVDLSEE